MFCVLVVLKHLAESQSWPREKKKGMSSSVLRGEGCESHVTRDLALLFRWEVVGKFLFCPLYSH